MLRQPVAVRPMLRGPARHSGPSRPSSPKGSREFCRIHRARVVGDKVEDHTKQMLLSRFSAWLDAAPDEGLSGTTDGQTPPEELEPTTDLYSLFVEMAGL